MFHLTQYVVVRRDLPLDAIMPQVAHAVGKAMFGYTAKLALVYPEARALTLNLDWGHPTRIIRGARNEGRLRKLMDKLLKTEDDFVTIVEPDDGQLKGQMTALALFPIEKSDAPAALNEFHDFKWQDVPAFAALLASLKPKP